ncbi:hypothetical protein FHR83_004103 [Actinoplanes campanulatus]|uniref:Uncharacterized protein n=1 Tax=Actinoplanes campanulatus TaxID=113559 RepID=A0A7W5AHL0_9ACTN|nr:hypothetical protein [Actinoplanes campanulatus]MBB3096433.1 hypothetical protein [Actinoplanes campanulatus]GGN18359.1 hypothetical protein GCM10010109_31370 [Actinoplanes campanulatus]GID38499.1 hypothetical protein Aca09nite_50050 [Actinoplanes campanulatus]
MADDPGRWCRACGTTAGDGAGNCAECGVDLAAPAAGDTRIGQVVVLPGLFLTRTGIVVAATGDTLSVLGKGDQPNSVGAAEFARMRPVDVPGPAVIGEAGRLWAASHAAGTGAVKASWNDARLKTYADDLAGRDLGRRRAAAADAIALGRQFWLPQAKLTETELCWYQARQAALRGDLGQMMAWLAKLPTGRYAVRIPLLLSHTAGLLADTGLAAHAAAQLTPFEDTHPDARALRHLLDPDAGADLIHLTVAYAATSGVPKAVAAAERIRDRRRIPIEPHAGPNTRALDAYFAGLNGTNLDQYAGLLTELPEALLDDLVDAHALTKVDADGTARGAYLRCRLHPGRVTPDELAAAGFTAEQARRHYLARDTDALDALDGADPAVGHYRALLAFVRDRDRGQADDLWPQTRALVDLIDGGGEVPEQLAADRSAWPLLRDAALQGRITVPEHVSAAHPDFAAWYGLCRLTRLVYDGDWEGTVRLARAIGRATRGGPLADEVASLVAYAKWQLGDHDGALAALDTGPAARFRAGLTLNASVIAAEKGSAAAQEPLARLAREAPDQRLRNGALIKALGLWIADDAVTEYPPELAALVHGRLADRIDDDDFFLDLLKFSANNDASWVAATPAIRATGGNQADMVRYFQTRCRILEEHRPETFSDLAEVLSQIWRRDPRPEWQARERDWFADLLLDLVHRDFGEAAGLAGVIEILLDGGVLEPRERLILSMQAGGHLAMGLGDDQDLRPESEKRFLFDPAYEFLRVRDEFPEPVREALAEELGRCLGVAAFAVGNAMSRAVDNLGDQYNEIVERRSWDRSNDYSLSRIQLELLDHMQTVVDRMRAYQVLLVQFPLDGPMNEIPDMLRGQADALAGQIDMLRRDF